MSILYYGDNIDILRNHVASESVDLIYLDPPFNSKRNYNLLFKSPEGSDSKAQITAFEDTWVWGDGAALAFDEVMRFGYAEAATMLNAMRSFLGESDVMAYLSMMALRLIELHRVLKPTGSIYLHCDPTASHYLKIILDGIFGIAHYRNEIIWKRSNPKSHISQNFPTCTDTILRYSKSDKAVYHQPYESHDPEYVEAAYKYRDEHGVYRLLPLLNPNDNRPNLTYEFLGVTRVWRWTKERMQKAYEEGLVVQLKPGAVPQYKKYLHDSKGRTVTNCWTDIPQAAGNESLGYPTQKPLELLIRIIEASSNEGDLILDPFCGCGTTVDAAQKLGRRWIGIDITHLAVGLIERRLKARYPGITFEIRGMPRDIDGLRAMAEQARANPRLYYELQYWAINQIPAAQHAQNQKKGADRGIDGIVWLRPGKSSTYEKALISVKAGDNVTVQMIRDLRGTVERDKAKLGIFLTLADPTKPMRAEAAAAGLADLEGVKCPRIQIVTFDDLLNGRQPQLPYADYAFAPSKAKQAEGEQGQLL